jgi:uncharacterized membrane protein
MFKKTTTTQPVYRDMSNTYTEVVIMVRDFCILEKGIKNVDIQYKDTVLFNLATLNLKMLSNPSALEQLYKLLTPSYTQWLSVRLDNLCVNITMKYGQDTVKYFENMFITSMIKHHGLSNELVHEILKNKPSVWLVPIIQYIWLTLP